jgi:hypothetical protein
MHPATSEPATFGEELLKAKGMNSCFFVVAFPSAVDGWLGDEVDGIWRGIRFTYRVLDADKAKLKLALSES